MIPEHHLPGGGFRNPWPEAADDDAVRKRFRELARERATRRLAPNPPKEALPLAQPDLAFPSGDAGELRITWVGHATHFIQLPQLNLLTDPIWSARASPIASLGPRRFVPAVPAIADLPRIDAVLLSHDHSDHLDLPTVRALRKRFGPDLPWFVPLGYAGWFAGVGFRNVRELDWWEEADLPGGYRAAATPARHWTRRTPWTTNRRLWCSWAIVGTAAAAPRVYFGADSAYASHYAEIGRRMGGFDAVILPIGAYDPQWFMGTFHMNPEEAVRAYEDLGARGAFLPSHWGTFRLTFEDPLEPPRRLRAAWVDRGLPAPQLYVPRHGETVSIRHGRAPQG